MHSNMYACLFSLAVSSKFFRPEIVILKTKSSTMKKYLLSLIIVFSIITSINGQEINPWLFGQNHWMADSDEGKRPGYLHLLWPKVEERGIKLAQLLVGMMALNMKGEYLPTVSSNSYIKTVESMSETEICVMSKSGVVLMQFSYGLTHNLKNLPPEEK
jgi:hypothetical protein